MKKWLHQWVPTMPDYPDYHGQPFSYTHSSVHRSKPVTRRNEVRSSPQLSSDRASVSPVTLKEIVLHALIRIVSVLDKIS